MAQSLNLLIVEDNPADLELLLAELETAGFAPKWKCVQTEADYLAQLHAGIDLVISDYELPQFNGLQALRLLRERGLMTPFLIVSGTIGEETAVATMRQGASDYLLKDRLARLGSAVRQALEQGALRQESERSKQALFRAEGMYRSLFENSIEGIYQTTQSGRLINANPALARIAGYDSPEEMIAGTTDIAAQLYANPEDRAGFEKLMRAQGFVKGFELQMRRRNGELFWVSTSARLIIDQSGTACYEGSLEDITERKRAEQALREQAALLRETGQIAKVGGWEFDPVTGNGKWTEEVARIHDLPAGDIPNKQMGLHFYHGEHRARLEEALKQTIERGVPYDLELELVSAAGRRKWVRTISHPIVENGRVVRVRGSFQDITERKQAEEALRESERFVRAALNGLTAHIAIVDEDGIILAVNDAWRTFASENEFRLSNSGEGTNYLDICSRAQGVGAAEARDCARAILEIIRGERGLYEAEYPCHAPGRENWFMVRVTPFPGQGRRRVVVAHEDITRRKQQEQALRESEARFRQIAENISEVFWMTDVNKSVVFYISPAYEKIWGRTREDLYAAPLTWLNAVYLQDRERVQQAAFEKQPAGTYDETYRVVRPDGKIRWVRERAYPIRDEHGEIYRIAGTAEDITEHRLLAAQFQQAQKMEAIGTMAGGIAHDFNNVLAGIVGYAELAKVKFSGNEEAREYLDALLEGASRATSLVKQIMIFSRQQEQRREILQLRDAVAEPLKLLRATIPTTIAFDINFEENLPAVLADETQIHQVVMNLCTNAWHAMKDRNGRLMVRLDRFTVDAHLASTNPHLRSGPYVRLTVSDTGHGMDRATLERIFDPFFSTKAPGEGTGLGLAAVHGIMKNHDGTVTVYSQPGEGTTFHLYFPAQSAKPRRSATPFGKVQRGRGERVLFLDDELPLALLGKAMLQELGYNVTAFSSSVEALAALRAEPAAFDLVITDLTMPAMTGPDLIQQLRLIRPELPVILSTGYTASLTPERIAALGIGELLLKPHTLRSLGESVHRVLAQSRLRG